MAGTTSKSRKSVAKAVPVEDGDVYTIEKIVDYREDQDGPKWLIRWKNYTAADDTWEPAENIMADDKKLQSEMQLLQAEFREAKESAKSPTSRTNSSPKKRMASRSRQEPAATKAKTRTSDLRTSATNQQHSHSSSTHQSAPAAPPASTATAKTNESSSRQTDTAGRGRPTDSTKAERKPDTNKPAKTATRTKVLHIRRFPDRDDDFQCVLANSDGNTDMMAVSEARKIYYNELIDYLLKRVKFLETANN